jgi:hypothetical protein
MATTPGTSWWATGLIFENCSCQLVCPGHIHFDQLCTHERCKGYWAFRFDEGSVDGADLAGARVVIAFDSPRRMIDGGWTQVMLVDDSTSPAQQRALEAVFDGSIGGPWRVLSRFVGERLPTRAVPIVMDHGDLQHRVGIAGLLRASVEAIRGRDPSQPVRFENIFNQIHSPTQVVGRGDSQYDDGTIRFEQTGTHGLWSAFDWRVTA